MNQQAKEGIQVFRQSHDFLTSHNVTAAHGPVTTQTEELKGIAERLTTFGTEQDEARRAYHGLTSMAHVQARKLRVELLRPISRMAQRLFPNEPELLQSLRMPARTDYQQLLTAATAFIAVAEKHKDMFVTAGLGQDFLTTLKTGADELRATLDARAAARGRRTAATAGLNQELLSGKALLRLLNDMVGPPLRTDQSRYAKWKSLTRFAQKQRDRNGDNPSGTTTGGTVPPAPGTGQPAATPPVEVPVREAA